MGGIERIALASKSSDKVVFEYRHVKTGTVVDDADVLKRIGSLRIPPGYVDVVISTNSKDKVQAFGYDTKGRKQTMYAKWFIERQRRKKFARVLAMEETINAIEAAALRELQGAMATRITKKCQICLIVRMMMLCNFRIGSDANVKKNKSYGLTTLEWRHITLKKGGVVSISFVGKKGVVNEAVCSDRMVYRIIAHMRRVAVSNAGSEGRIFDVTAHDVNEFLRDFDAAITSKDIRTWQANALFIKYFVENRENEDNVSKRQRNAIQRVAADLHHTPAVCKSAYLYPDFVA